MQNDRLLKISKLYAEIDEMLKHIEDNDLPKEIKQEFRNRIKKRILRMMIL